MARRLAQRALDVEVPDWIMENELFSISPVLSVFRYSGSMFIFIFLICKSYGYKTGAFKLI